MRALTRVTARSHAAAPPPPPPTFIEPPPFEPPVKTRSAPLADTGVLATGRLTEDEVLIRATARQYCQEKLAPRIVEAHRHELVDSDVFREMGSRLLGAQLSGYGCSGVSSNAYGLIANEGTRIDSSYRSMLSVQSFLVMHPIRKKIWQDQNGVDYCRYSLRASWWVFGLVTDLDVGSDPSGMATRATYDGTTGGIVLNGSKHWITNAPIADVCVVWARLDNHVRGFIVGAVLMA